MSAYKRIVGIFGFPAVRDLFIIIDLCHQVFLIIATFGLKFIVVASARASFEYWDENKTSTTGLI